jgi:SAM-dependent methyltransferase
MDRELEAGTSAHYEDPAYYAKTYKARTDDVRYYVRLASECGGPVLEYGCGNGRITLPIARAGIEIVGLDRSGPMLADLRQRLRAEAAQVAARVTLHRGDMRRAQIGRRFPLVICPFNAFLHLYERRDIEQFLARARQHLSRAGQFVFDVSVPDAAELARDPRRAFKTPAFRYPTGELVRYAERFDYDRARQILFVSMEFEPMGGGKAWMTPLAHRQFYPEELSALLHYNGFRIIARYGGFERERYDREANVLVVVARRGRC